MTASPTGNNPDPAVPASPAPSDPGPLDALLLDLDGTITDSAPAITDSFAETLTEMGIPVPDKRTLMGYVGPPLAQTFNLVYGLSEPVLSQTVASYRRHYATRMLSAQLYPGIGDLLHRLHNKAIPLALATSKNEEYAVRILDHAGLLPLFTVVSGADPQDRMSKAEVIAQALERLRSAGVTVSRAVHVGDRRHDVQGAHVQGLPCVGVLWGYGDAEELSEADWLVGSSSELATLLGLEER